ncbi:MAG TPA: hypothetical protein VFG89_02405 [Coriobacteriia bacterium]|nr:hypothetical protein [Coriobacteriia bacterium]
MMTRARKADAIDFGLSVFAAMILWPFPIARQYLPAFLQVAGVLVTIVIALVAYGTVATAWRKTTAGAYLCDVGLEGEGGPLRFGLGWMLLAVAGLFKPQLLVGSGSALARLSGRWYDLSESDAVGRE